MPNTSVRAAAEGLPANTEIHMSETIPAATIAATVGSARNSQRPSLVERLLMPFAGRAEEATMQEGLSFMNQTVNRRAIMAAAPTGVAGIVAAGMVGGAAEAFAAPAQENPELLRLASELEAELTALLEATVAAREIEAEWSPLWPLAPDEITLPRANDNPERDIRGRGFIRKGADEPCGLRDIDNIESLLAFSKRGGLHARTKSSPQRRERMTAQVNMWRAALKMAKAYYAEIARIRDVSAIALAEEKITLCRKRIDAVVGAIMVEEPWTMDGLAIKAKAIKGFGAGLGVVASHAGKTFLVQNALADSILRLADVSRGTDAVTA
ncbi:hypothetical protein GCM10007881_64100 [Mesorhizobium huakuii]|uniref:hypothetical protein n=1 Tax=Mesorhizobium huakuii TaxID=28104 RepID=UPI00235BCE27|nr:hypothetical protein [Mesorhizobium huakuii]GLQ82887.1 hypothetical protein GCM10007881_64100 [Mesorhizobium huakuii]